MRCVDIELPTGTVKILSFLISCISETQNKPQCLSASLTRHLAASEKHCHLQFLLMLGWNVTAAEYYQNKQKTTAEVCYGEKSISPREVLIVDVMKSLSIQNSTQICWIFLMFDTSDNGKTRREPGNDTYLRSVFLYTVSQWVRVFLKNSYWFFSRVTLEWLFSIRLGDLKTFIMVTDGFLFLTGNKLMNRFPHSSHKPAFFLLLLVFWVSLNTRNYYFYAVRLMNVCTKKKNISSAAV